ncbi:pirin family protein [Psychrobacter celer]|uniref:pirin family protein n=1 Tax=Psychrobacter celer TaxID=306572 RepID=UPI003FD537EE
MDNSLINNVKDTVTHSRQIEQLHAGVDTQDGAGVKLTRVLTQQLQQRLDPYLMLDNFKSDNPDDYIAGFPNHPHRGFETITYMITGRMRHRDSAGNEGLLQNGGVQWMTAASGVIHSELPEQEDGAMEGFQLWLNLPAKDKMNDPWYKDFQSEDLPKYTTEDGVDVTVIAGTSHGVEGAVTRDITEPTYLDIHLPAGMSYAEKTVEINLVN